MIFDFTSKTKVNERFLNSNPKNFNDYELLVFLLFFNTSKKNAKLLAKKLLDEFGSLYNLIFTEKEKLLKIKWLDQSIISNCILLKEVHKRILKNKITNKNVISSYHNLVDYLKCNIGNSKVERLQILFLNTKNILLADEIMSIGTIDNTAIYPREIVKRALFHEASAIILVHNHPSGIVKPSAQDILLTDKIIQTCSVVGIKVHDHIIVTSNKDFSFKAEKIPPFCSEPF